MVRAIVKDALFLGQKSVLATTEDAPVIDDLLDTLKANAEHCVGLAANMIGIKKRIIFRGMFIYLFLELFCRIYIGSKASKQTK